MSFRLEDDGSFALESTKELKAEIAKLCAALEEIANNDRIGTYTLTRENMMEIARKALANKQKKATG